MDNEEAVVLSDVDIIKNITVTRDINHDSNATAANNMKLEEDNTEKEMNTNIEPSENKINEENHIIAQFDIDTTINCTGNETDTKTEKRENIIDENQTITDEVTQENKPEEVCDTDKDEIKIDENQIITDEVTQENKPEEVCDTDKDEIKVDENQTITDEVTQENKPEEVCDTDKDEIKVDVKIDTAIDCKDASENFSDDDEKAYKRYRLRQRQTKSYTDDEPPPSKKKKIKKTDTETNVDLTCHECYESFETKRGYSVHMTRHNQPEKFTCAQCSTEFLTNKELKDHKKVHDCEDRIFTCGQCKVAYSSNMEYLVHKAEHKTKDFNCEECGKMFIKNRVNAYREHLFSHFNETYKCDVCQKVFKNRLYYLQHSQSHDSKTSYVCGECGKDCKDKKYYDYHMCSHTGVKVYQCLYCAKGFANSGQRKTHTIRIHLDERPFKCPTCDQAFKQSVDLKWHIQSKHTLAKTKYKCPVCKKEYKSKGHLTFHMRLHTKKDLIPCPVCDEKFILQANLNKHYIYRHTSEKPFQCDVCKVAFKDVGGLRRHLKARLHKNNAYGVELKRKKLEQTN